MLNRIHPADGSRKNKRRVGRGIGSTMGKTCGSGHKGQKSRSGGLKKVGFEGGQMPIQRRLPKFGFTSRKSLFRVSIRLDQIAKLAEEIIDMSTLRKHNLINHTIKQVKVFAAGTVEKPIVINGIAVTKGAKQLIEAAGGRVENS